MGGEFGGKWIHVYVWLSPFTVYLKLTTLLIGFTEIQNKKFKIYIYIYTHTHIHTLRQNPGICSATSFQGHPDLVSP